MFWSCELRQTMHVSCQKSCKFIHELIILLPIIYAECGQHYYFAMAATTADSNSTLAMGDEKSLAGVERTKRLATTVFKRTATGGHGFVILWGWVSLKPHLSCSCIGQNGNCNDKGGSVVFRFGSVARADCYIGRTGRNVSLSCLSYHMDIS